MLFVDVPAAYPAILLAVVAIKCVRQLRRRWRPVARAATPHALLPRWRAGPNSVECLLTGFIVMGIARREYKVEYPSLDGPKVRRRR